MLAGDPEESHRGLAVNPSPNHVNRASLLQSYLHSEVSLKTQKARVVRTSDS